MSRLKNVNKKIKRVMLSKKCQISREDRTITALTNLNGRVYVYCGGRKTLQQFIEDAENEYFRYGDGVLLSQHFLIFSALSNDVSRSSRNENLENIL
ncbi:MAG: hypothetical protein LUJ09_02820 [Firmicutes bacterium]|nr:hypothetical protein [Bacillota bacterium]